MKRLNTLGLLAVAAMAIAAFVGTTSASATTSGSFTSTEGAGKALVTEKITQHVFTVTGAKTECKKVTFTGSTEGAETTSQSVTPDYKECTAFGLPATVTNTNCKIKLTATTDKEGGHAEAHLEQANTAEGQPACQMQIVAKNIFGECVVDVNPQTVKGIHYVNNASPEDVKVQVTSGETMKAMVTKSTGVCPLTVKVPAEEHVTASYTGEETVQATGGVQFMEMASAGAP